MAFGNQTFALAGGAVNDIFGGQAESARMSGQATSLLFRAQGSRLQAKQLDRAAGFSDLNADLSLVGSDIKSFQADRAAYLGIGRQESDVAGSGFTEGGSAGDLLRDSMSQAALQSAVLQMQGKLEEMGYDEQAAGQRASAEASRLAATADEAAAMHAMQAASDAERNGWITGGLKAAGAIATLGF